MSSHRRRPTDGLVTRCDDDSIAVDIDSECLCRVWLYRTRCLPAWARRLVRRGDGAGAERKLRDPSRQLEV